MTKYLIALTFLSTSFSSCTDKQILFKPKIELDPLPLVNVKSPVVEGVDPLFKTQWNLLKIGLAVDGKEASGKRGSPNVRIAILSTGIQYLHEDLQNRVEVNMAEYNARNPQNPTLFNGKDDDQNGLVDDVVGYDVVSHDGLAFDRNGAGTAAAGIIGAVSNNGIGIAGMMDDVRLIPIRFVNDNGQTTLAHLVEALDVVVKLKPDVAFIHSIDVRLGGARKNAKVVAAESEILTKKLAQVANLGIPLIIGAGQTQGIFGSKDIEKIFISFDNVIAVTASDEKDQLSFPSNVSLQHVVTAAPGENIPTLGLENPEKYTTVSSTAYAAAHVTGMVGIAKARYGSAATVSKIKMALMSEENSDDAEGLRTASLGRNRVNVSKFLKFF